MDRLAPQRRAPGVDRREARFGQRSEPEPTAAEVRHRTRHRPRLEPQEVAPGLEKVSFFFDWYLFHSLFMTIFLAGTNSDLPSI